MKKMFPVLLVSCLVAGPVSADNCSSLIQHGLYNEIRKSSSVSSYQEMINNICKDYSMYKSDTQSGNIKATYGAFGGKAGYTAATYKEIADNMCSEYGSIDELSKKNSVLEKIISPDAIDAYKTCKQLDAKGLKVDTKITDDGDYISVSLYYQDHGVTGNDNDNNLFIEIHEPNITNPEKFTCEGSLKPNSKLELSKTVEYHCFRQISGREEDVFTYQNQRIYAKSATLTIPTSVATIYREIPAVLAVQKPSPIKGAIMAFSPGLPIPDGWAVCDGANGTPDLRDKFVLGTSDAGTAGQPGGSESHNHSVTVTLKQGPWKGSDANWGGTPWRNGPNPARGTDTANVSHSGASNMPPHVKLIYIMKL